MKKIKILHIIPRFYAGGAERLVLQYASLMDKSKFEVHVASAVEDGELRTSFEKNKTPLFVGSRKKMGGRLKVWKNLLRYIDKIQPKIIHSHLLGADIVGFLAKRKFKNKIKWIVTLHNVEHRTSFLRKLVWKIILKKADRIIAVAEPVKDFAVNNFKINKNKVTLVLNGVDLDKWSTLANKKIFQKKEINIATIGRLEEQKGHRYLLEALGNIKDLPWTYHVFGDGSLESSLKVLADRFGIADRIVWHGLVYDGLVKKVGEIDLVVQPSLWEGLSLVVMEVMSAGRCVVASSAAGDSLVENNQTGYIFPNKDIKKLSKILKYVFENNKEAAMLGKRAGEYAQQNFSLQKNVSSIEKIYHDFL